MKRLVLIISAILSLATLQAQTPVTDGYLTDGDIVTISTIAREWSQSANQNVENRYYLEASYNGIQTRDYATDECLWRLGITANGNSFNYTLQDLTTSRYISISERPNNPSYSLQNNATALSLERTPGENNKPGICEYGKLYYRFWYRQWNSWQSIFIAQGGWNPLRFTPSTSNALELYIEKWEHKGAGKPTGHFNPSKIEFAYAENIEKTQAVTEQVTNVEFMIEATTESYYQCVNRPEEALLRRQTNDVHVDNIQIKNIYWQSTGNEKSDLNVSKYVAHQDENRTLMTVSDPETTTGGEQKTWQFTVTPYGNSPMGLKDTLGTLERWIDYADNVIVEYTYGNGEVQKAEMRVVRKAYHQEELPAITYSISPVNYTFSIAQETKAFDVTLTHQHGTIIYNVDHQPVKEDYTYKPVHVKLSDFDEKFTAQDGWVRTYQFLHQPTTPWLSLDVERFQQDGFIYVTAQANTTGAKRSDTLEVTLTKTGGEHQHGESFKIPLSQRGVEGGIQFFTQAGEGATQALKDSWNKLTHRQQVHTAERTIYYLPNQEIELRLPESGYSGYMRWYDYETNGDPYYNYAVNEDSTTWIRSPRAANGNAFSAINTPIDNSNNSLITEGRSYGLYAINKDKDGNARNGTDAAIGGVLDEGNPDNPAPILKGWHYTTAEGAYHTMACDVSAYTDYTIWTSQNGARIDSIMEPTLSYRQLFHLRPASEMADTLAARSARGVYLENYKYQAPAGKQILLSTEYRHSKVRSHASELCYFYKDTDGDIHRIDNRQGNMLKWYVSDKDGSNRQEYTPRYIAAMDYLIVRSEVYTYDAPKVYTLVLPANSEHREYLIARFEVEYVDIERQGPTNKTIITQQRINNQYKKLSEINFDELNTHLGWDEASYGYVYQTSPLNTQFKRGASQGAFPFYGEYMLTTRVDKDWARESAHGGKGQSLYVDGTMEPGLVATISASGQICSGQTMYCSAWFCNPAPSGWSGEGNPIFRCNIQGKNDNEAEWHDVGVYFVGELLKGTHWQQVVFPIRSEESYDHIRVSIYNFATTNQGNDFMVDDINLFVSQLPITAYQGEMACRTVESGETSAAAVLRIDYNNITAGSDGYMYYQIYNETYTRNDTTGFPVTLKGEAAYYHDYDDEHGGLEHNHPYGSVHIPENGFDPEVYNSTVNEADTVTIHTSVSAFLDDLVIRGEKHGKAYIRTENSGVIKWLLYVAHIVNNTTNADSALNKLYGEHSYVLRMAYTPEELPEAKCNLTTPLHATQKTVFHLRNSDKQTIKHTLDGQSLGVLQGNLGTGEDRYLSARSYGNCPNDLYSLTSTVINHLSLQGAGGATTDIPAAIFSDWLIGDPDEDVLSEPVPSKGDMSDEEYQNVLTEYNNRLQEAIAGFKDKYGYTHDEVTSAIMYDMRRYVTDDPNSPEYNPNHQAKSFEELQPNKFLSPENYEIIKHLCDNGWLQLYDTTVNFYLGSRLNKNNQTIGDTVRYWCFPIAETAKTTVKIGEVDTEITLKDCNEPHRVTVSANGSGYYMNITPIAFADKTPQQSVQLPTIKVVKGSTSIVVPVKELNGVQTAGLANGQITVELSTATYFNLETGEKYTTTPELLPGNEYIIRLTLTDGSYEYPGGITSSCRYGYVFLTLQILPRTLIWVPKEAHFNGWGKNENWKGLVYNNEGQVTDTVEGYVPTSQTNVIIPHLGDPQLYPYVVPEHEHSHYPMTIGFQPHHCDSIYFAPGTHIYNQHLLEYKKAFVDMQLPAAKWHLVSAPLQGMVSGDMFVPHNGWYSESQHNRIDEPKPFDVSGFRGIRHADAAYAFWEAFYNTDVDGSNTQLRDFDNIQFTQSNSLAQPLEEGHGYAVYGLGHQETEQLTVRLPKPDTQYYYYNEGEKDESSSVIFPQNNRGRLAYTANHDDQKMTITLTNQTESEYFLFGNPTMAFVDMHALYLSHTDQWSGEFKTMQSNIIHAATQATLTPEDRYLPPMTSALLKALSNSTDMTITLLPSHLTLNNTINPADTAEQQLESAPMRRVVSIEERPVNYNALQSELLTIYAFTPKGTARTVLATNPTANDYYTSGEDALFTSTGVENESYVTTPLNMYTVAEQVPMMADVRQGISEIPLAILAADKARAEHMQIAFYLSSNWSRECYFYDSQTGQRIRIMDGLIITIEMPQNHEQRYYIEGPDEYLGDSNDDGPTTATNNVNSNSSATLSAYSLAQGELCVSSNLLIRQVKLYDLTGRLIVDKPLQLLNTTTTLAAPSGICLVEAILRDGTTLHTQSLVK